MQGCQGEELVPDQGQVPSLLQRRHPDQGPEHLEDLHAIRPVRRRPGHAPDVRLE
jgi:hypothetical protein